MDFRQLFGTYCRSLSLGVNLLTNWKNLEHQKDLNFGKLTKVTVRSILLFSLHKIPLGNGIAWKGMVHAKTFSPVIFVYLLKLKKMKNEFKTKGFKIMAFRQLFGTHCRSLSLGVNLLTK